MLAVNWLYGMFRRISFDRVTDAVSVDLTSTVGDWAMTVISSEMAAGLSVIVSVSVAEVVNRIFSWMTVPNPWSSAWTWKTPGGRAGNRNSPLESVTVVRIPMRFPPESVTLTPGRGEFWSSNTTPRSAPVSRDWEKTTGARRRVIARMESNVLLKQASFLVGRDDMDSFLKNPFVLFSMDTSLMSEEAAIIVPTSGSTYSICYQFDNALGTGRHIQLCQYYSKFRSIATKKWMSRPFGGPDLSRAGTSAMMASTRERMRP